MTEEAYQEKKNLLFHWKIQLWHFDYLFIVRL